MMARIFAYIIHKDGVADDTAAELLAAAKKIDAAAALPRLWSRVRAQSSTPSATASRLLCRGMEDRERQPGLSQCRAGSQSAGKGRAGGQHRAGSPQSFRHRSRRRDSPSS